MPTVRGRKEDSVHIVCHCAALACKIYRNLGRVFLTPKGLENMRVNGLINLVANTRLGILKYRGDTTDP